MNTDIRLATTFVGHRKRKRLKRLLGPGYLDYLIDLWLRVAQCCPDGELTEWTPQDIADEAGYDGDADKFINALIDSGWLECDKKTKNFRLHDWRDYQGWCSGVHDRKNKARIAAIIKHHGKKAGLKIAKEKYDINPADYGYYDGNQNPANSASSMPPASHRHATGMPPASQGQCAWHAPSPSPSLGDFTKVKSGKPVKSKKHFSDKAGDYLKPIKKACQDILKLPSKNGNKFNPYQFVQQQTNKSAHPGAILEALEGMKKLWSTIDKPWPYAESIMKTINGNYNEKDSIKKSQQFKTMLADLAAQLKPD